MTVQDAMLRLAMRIDPRTKRSQVFQSLSAKVAITNCADNGSTLIRVTTTSAHGLEDNDQVYISGVTGTTEANNTLTNRAWSVTVINATTVDLQGSTFVTPFVSGGYLTGALIGTVDGNMLSQRLLDIYNEARMTLAGWYSQMYGEDKFLKCVDGNVVPNALLTFSAGVATKPTGFIKEIFLKDPTGKLVSVADAQNIPRLTPYINANTKWVYRAGNQFVSPDTSVVADGAYSLSYLGITSYTLTDVINGTTNESFNEDFIPRLLILAEAISLEDGKVAPMAIAAKLLGPELIEGTKV